MSPENVPIIFWAKKGHRSSCVSSLAELVPLSPASGPPESQRAPQGLGLVRCEPMQSGKAAFLTGWCQDFPSQGMLGRNALEESLGHSHKKGNPVGLILALESFG